MPQHMGATTVVIAKKRCTDMRVEAQHVAKYILYKILKASKLVLKSTNNAVLYLLLHRGERILLSARTQFSR